MQKLGELVQDPQRLIVQSQQLSAQPSQVAMRDSPEAQKQMANLIFQCFQSLKLYGKEPEALESMTPMFNLVLAEYPMEKIQKAMAFYLKTNNEMPAPADIAMIIERGNKPPFDRAVYISISKKRGEDRSSDEWEYVRDYEKFITTGKM